MDAQKPAPHPHRGPESAELFTAGSRIGGYRLIEKLGAGGMAEVWLASAEGVAGQQKRVVLKRILDHLAEEPEALAMFLDEARLAARLHHPHIVRIEELLQEQGHYLIAMEYIPGRSLRQILKRLRERKLRLGPEASATVATRVCEGLDYAHSALDHDSSPMRLVHRDITPQNILLSDTGHTKIIDFGIARAASRLAQTATGVLKGTPFYMAPEQARGDKSVDHRADIYALGSTLYELVTGARPFAGTSVHAVLVKAAMGERPLHPAQQRGSVPEALGDVIWKAMEPDPDRRYQSALQFQRALESWLAGRPGGIVGTQRIAMILESLFSEGVDPATASTHGVSVATPPGPAPLQVPLPPPPAATRIDEPPPPLTDAGGRATEPPTVIHDARLAPGEGTLIEESRQRAGEDASTTVPTHKPTSDTASGRRRARRTPADERPAPATIAQPPPPAPTPRGVVDEHSTMAEPALSRTPFPAPAQPTDTPGRYRVPDGVTRLLEHAERRARPVETVSRPARLPDTAYIQVAGPRATQELPSPAVTRSEPGRDAPTTPKGVEPSDESSETRAEPPRERRGWLKRFLPKRDSDDSEE